MSFRRHVVIIALVLGVGVTGCSRPLAEAGVIASVSRTPVVDPGPGFPADLNDASLRRMYADWWGFIAFHDEDQSENIIGFSDMMEFRHTQKSQYADTPRGRLERELDMHYIRWERGQPESPEDLLALLAAAEAIPIYNGDLAAHLWRDALVLPAPIELIERIDRHLRVVFALQRGAMVLGAVNNRRGNPVPVPAGLAAAAASVFPGIDLGAWDTYGSMLLKVERGRVVLTRHGVSTELAVGDLLTLARLDIVSIRAATTLRHSLLGAFPIPEGAVLTGANVREFLRPPQREHVTRLVAAMRGGDREARAAVEVMLPAAHQAISDEYRARPLGAGENNAYLLLHRFGRE